MHGPSLDPVDLRILEVLQRDAWLENQELARRIALSPAACLRRVQRLRESGAISSVVALVDARQLGLEVHAYAFVTLENHRASSGSQFETVVKRHPEVMECVRLSGVHDYLLRVVVKSMSAYSNFLDRHILPLPAVRSVNTSFELGVLKRTTALPLSPRTRVNAEIGAQGPRRLTPDAGTADSRAPTPSAPRASTRRP